MIWQNHDVQHSYQEKLKKLVGCFERRHGDVGLLSMNLVMFMEELRMCFYSHLCTGSVSLASRKSCGESRFRRRAAALTSSLSPNYNSPLQRRIHAIASRKVVSQRHLLINGNYPRKTVPWFTLTII